MSRASSDEVDKVKLTLMNKDQVNANVAVLKKNRIRHVIVCDQSVQATEGTSI